MTVSGNGDDANKGGKLPVKKVGKSGAQIKGNDDKTSAVGKKKQQGKDTPLGIDQVFMKIGRDIERKKGELLGGGNGESEGTGKKQDPGDVLQTIVAAREKQVSDIETKISNTNDIREKSVLAVQLKGAQHALKEALVNMSLTQRKTEPATSATWNVDDDEEMQETNQPNEGKRTQNEANDDVNMQDAPLQDTEVEFYADNYEGPSDDDTEDDEELPNKKKAKKQTQTSTKEIILLTSSSDNEAGQPNKKTNFNTKSTDYNTPWGDISDDDTVVQTNMEQEDENGWQVATNKKSRKGKTANNSPNKGSEETKEKTVGHKNGVPKIVNPYKTNQTQGQREKNETKIAKQSSLASYAEAATGKQRSPNKNSISVTTSFTPRLSGAGEYKRVAKELLAYAKEIAPEVMMLPWNEHSGLGPIQEEDLVNPKNYMDTIKHYFHKPTYVTMLPGTPAYGIGVRFSVNSDKYEFLNKWNMKKREYKLNNRAAYTITLAPMQNSPTAFIIGIAVGSSENQDFELLNDRLEQATGIKGIEASYQNIHQSGITPEFWKMANNKASKSNSDRMSKEYLRTKYSWAPNGLAIYVPRREMVNAARKIMLRLYGKTVEGNDPVWPDGSSMRFLPIKGTAIKSDKTKEVIRKRLAFHIWLKANEISIATDMVNIHQSIDAFEGKTFSEIVLQATSKDGKNRFFTHFNRTWNLDPTKESWAIAVKTQYAEEATHYIRNVRDHLFDKYGPEVDHFFHKDSTSKEWVEAVNNNKSTQEDDDDWFEEDDDIDELVKKGLIDPSFIQFLKGQDNEKDSQSEASWGTGDTTYTEIVDHNDAAGTVNSSITQESSLEILQDIQKKKDLVIDALKNHGIPEETITQIANNTSPYELVFSGIRLQTWKPEKEIFYIKALYESNKPNPIKPHTENDEP
jgi:hypothetical protein